MALAATKKAKVRVRRPEDLERIGIVAIEGMLPMMGILSGILRSFHFQSVSVLGNSDEAWARLNGEPRLSERPKVAASTAIHSTHSGQPL